MKKIFNILLTAVAAIGLTTSCSDIPSPYDLAGLGSSSFGKTLPYKSAALSTSSGGWTTHCISADEPWSSGSSYIQATGYQAWDGASTKSNREVESYLISPAINTTCASGKVKLSFDETIRYTSSVSGWEKYHKVYISKTYDGKNFDKTQWTELSFTPVSSTDMGYSDWTLYTSGEIQIPDEFVNHDSVYVAFYFYAPEANSTTWELENFLIQEGVASGGGDTPTGDFTLPYTSSNLSTNWTTHDVTGMRQPWSQGSTYTQATGYQMWDGASTKSNMEVKGYLISPAINTTAASGKVKFSFDNTIRYTSNVSGWEAYHKIYISNDYDGTNFDKATWTEVSWTPTSSTYTDWTLYTSGEIQLPDAYVNKEKVYVAFYFYAPASGSTTWELENFTMKEGEAGQVDPTPTPSGDLTGDGTAANPYTVADVNTLYSTGKYSSITSAVYVKGVVTEVSKFNSTYGSINYYISDDASASNKFYIYSGLGLDKAKFTSENDLKVGDKVVVCGTFTVYSSTFEFQYNNYITSLNGEGEGGGDTPSGSSSVKIDGSTVTLTNGSVTAGTETETIDLNTFGWANQTTVSTASGKNCTITFSAGSNSKNVPTYYTGTKGVRVYAGNEFTITGTSKAIATAVITVDVYNGTTCAGQSTATVSCSGNNMTYSNAGSTTGTASQLRAQKIVITYAK